MKKLIVLSVFLFLSILNLEINAQSVVMYGTETTNYPIMRTGFKLFDSQNNEIRNTGSPKLITKDDIVITEIESDTIAVREVLADPDCPSLNQKVFSAVLVVDISESMNELLPDGKTRYDAAKDVLKEWANSFDPKRTETAITAFCGDAQPSTVNPNEPISVYTNDKATLLTAIKNLPNYCNGTNYNAAFLKSRLDPTIRHLSALYWCQPGKAKYKPVIVFLTDGNHLPTYGGPFQIDSVRKYAEDWNVTIYVIQFGDEIIDNKNKEHLEALAVIGKPEDDDDPNIWMGINDADELKGIYQDILRECGQIGETPPCYVNWKAACEGGSATFTFPNHGVVFGVDDYEVASANKPNLSITPGNPVFGNIAPPNSQPLTVTLKAEKNFVEIDSIGFINDNGLKGDLTIDWGAKAPPLKIEKDSSIQIILIYKPSDSLCSQGTIRFYGFACTGDEMNIKGEMQSFVEDIHMGNTNIGKPVDSVFTMVFCNKTCQVINIPGQPKIIGVDANNFTVLKPTGASVLNPGDCLEMKFRFNPNEPAGTKTAKIEIKTDYNNQTFTGDITGNAIGGKTITYINPGFDSTGCNTPSVENIITLENSGVETINGITCTIIPNEDNFEIKNDTWPTTLSGGDKGDVTIIYHPTNPAKQNADYTAALRVTSDADNPTYDIPLSGQMRNIDFTLSSAVNFGEVCVGTPQTRQVTLTNTGNVPLSVNAISTAPFQPANTNYSVPVGGNIPVDVECNPNSDGQYNSTLTITNPECNLTKTVALTAMGVYPKVSLDKQINLSATIGNNSSLDVTATNESNSDVEILDILPCDDVRFGISNINPSPLPQTIKPGDPISFTVTYTPQTEDNGLLTSCIRIVGRTCNFDTSITATGNPGAAIVHIEIDEHHGIAGDRIDIPVVLRNGDRFDESNTKKVSAVVRYDGSLLDAFSKHSAQPDPVPPYQRITLTDKSCTSTNLEQIIETLSFNIKTGPTPKSTPLEILNPSGNGGAGYIVKNGLFVLDEAEAVVSIDNVSALVGNEVKIKVRLKSSNPLPGNNTDRITAKISFDGYVLEPTNKPPLLDSVYFKDGKWTVFYKLPITPQSGDVLAELLFNTMIGLKNEVLLHIDSLEARGAILTPEDGTFKVLGLCQDGGNDNIRYFNPDSRAVILSLNPNPTNGMISIEYETAEKGLVSLWISDMLGNRVVEIFNSIPEPGKAKADFDGTQLPNGVYFVILQTATQTVREKIYIMR